MVRKTRLKRIARMVNGRVLTKRSLDSTAIVGTINKVNEWLCGSIKKGGGRKKDRESESEEKRTTKKNKRAREGRRTEYKEDVAPIKWSFSVLWRHGL